MTYFFCLSASFRMSPIVVLTTSYPLYFFSNDLSFSLCFWHSFRKLHYVCKSFSHLLIWLQYFLCIPNSPILISSLCVLQFSKYFIILSKIWWPWYSLHSASITTALLFQVFFSSVRKHVAFVLKNWFYIDASHCFRCF